MGEKGRRTQSLRERQTRDSDSTYHSLGTGVSLGMTLSAIATLNEETTGAAT